MSSVLSNYYRKPKFFINIPSQGKLYKNDNESILNEVGIMPMTMLNQLMVNNPENLINGSIIEELIRDCTNITSIEPRKLLKCDIDAICAGIRKSSDDDQLEFNLKCPECGETHTYGIMLSNILGNMTYHEELPKKWTIYDGELTLNITPYTLEQSIKIDDIFFNDAKELQELSKEMENQMIEDGIDKDDNGATEHMSQFMKKIQSIHMSMAVNTLEIYTDSIQSIETPNGIETDKEEIKNFLKQLDKDTFDEFKNIIHELENVGIPKTYPIRCESCEHNYDAPIELNHTDFFGNGS